MADEQGIIIVDASGTEHEFPPGFDPKKAAGIVRQQTAAPAAAPAPQGDLGRFGGYKMIGDAVMGAGKAALNHPVQSGAMLGGLLAVPLTGGASIPAAMAAAGLGAAGGAGLGSIVNARRGGEDGPKTAAGVLGTMGAEGAVGALGEGAGQGVSRLLKAGGKLVYKSALRPSMNAQREFGDLADVGLREGAPVSQGGAAKVEGQLNASGAQAKRMIADAETAGASPIQPKEVAREFGDVFQQGQRQAQLGRPDPRPAEVARLKAFSAKNPNGIPLGRAQALKGEAQELASKAYRAEDLGHPISDLSAAGDKAQARGLRKGIEARVPGIDAVNSRSQDLIGLLRTLEDANRRNVPGVGSLRTLLGDFVPSVSSRGGIAAHQAGSSPITAAAMRTALIALMGQMPQQE